MRFRSRRVIVKARVVKMRGTESKAAYAHLRYLQRDGVTRESERGRLYSSWQDKADGSRFLDRGMDDRHQFRLIVAPEDGAELGDDLRGFTRELMNQIERDLETDLDWVAVDHFNTGHPHTHIVIRGVTDDDKILNIAGDYIAHGIRYRASEILTLELGPQSELEVQQQLGREVDQERFTRLDRALKQEINEDGLIDMRAGEQQSYLGRINHHLLVQRLRKLERMELATEQQPGRWSLADRTEKVLRDLGIRGDIIKSMHQTVTEQGLDRGVGEYVIHHEAERQGPTVGRVIGKGLASDELTGKLHLVVDGVDGRVHYAEMNEAAVGEIKVGGIVAIGQAQAAPRESDRNIAAFARENGGTYEPAVHLEIVRDTVKVPGDNHEGYVLSHVRRLEALRRAGIVERLSENEWRIPNDFEQRALEYDSQRTKQLGVRVVSLIDLDAQVTADAATWLDRELIADSRTPMAMGGFGAETRQAMVQRQRWLIEQELMTQKGDDLLYPRNLLGILARREVEEVGRKLAAERGIAFRLAGDGERITGTYKESVQLVSGRYALLEKSREFTLVPWRPVIEREIGRQIAGQVMGDGISWEFGRKRGLGIGM